MKKFKNLKLNKKTISSLSDLEMSYVKGAYGTGAGCNDPGTAVGCTATTPGVTSCACTSEQVCGGGGGVGSDYSGTCLQTSIFGTHASQGCGLGDC